MSEERCVDADDEAAATVAGDAEADAEVAGDADAALALTLALVVDNVDRIGSTNPYRFVPNTCNMKMAGVPAVAMSSDVADGVDRVRVDVDVDGEASSSSLTMVS